VASARSGEQESNFLFPVRPWVPGTLGWHREIGGFGIREYLAGVRRDVVSNFLAALTRLRI
jgi:hypothetical protein